MVLNKGGYVIINKSLDNVYELAKNAITSGKPILWYETNTKCYFIDTFQVASTDIILTKGGKKIIISANGNIIEIGSISPQVNHLYEHKVKLDYRGEDEEIVFFIYYNNSNEEIDITNINLTVNGIFYDTNDDTNVPFYRIYTDGDHLTIMNINNDDLQSEAWLISNLGEELSVTETITQIF